MNTHKISGIIDSVWIRIGRADVARHQGDYALMDQELDSVRELLFCVDMTQKIDREFVQYVNRFIARYVMSTQQVSA